MRMIKYTLKGSEPFYVYVGDSVFSVSAQTDFRAGLLDVSGTNRMTETEAAEARAETHVTTAAISSIGELRRHLNGARME